MSTIGTLAINVVAKTAQAAANLKKFTTRISGVTAAAKKNFAALSKMAGIFTGLGIALSGAAIAGNLRATAGEIDRLAKTADKLKVTTEALGTLQYAAELNGIAADKMAMGLQRMTRRISEAAAGAGELRNILPQVGLSAKRLVEMNPAEQFERVIAALDKVPKGDRIRTAFKFFDSEGVDLIRLAGQNLGKYREEAERLGFLVSRGDAAAIEKMNDSLAKVGRAFQGVSNRIVIALAPAVAETVDGMLVILDELKRLRGREQRQPFHVQARRHAQRYITGQYSPLLVTARAAARAAPAASIAMGIATEQSGGAAGAAIVERNTQALAQLANELRQERARKSVAAIGQ